MAEGHREGGGNQGSQTHFSINAEQILRDPKNKPADANPQILLPSAAFEVKGSRKKLIDLSKDKIPEKTSPDPRTASDTA